MNDLDLVPGRGCGGCTVCCTAMAIDKPEMQKEAGIACRHCENSACAIYETRPALCRNFDCGWRQLPILDDSWRPDRSGVFVEIEVIDNETAISLILTGNPLKIIRQEWFLEFVMTGIAGGVPIHLGIPGPVGCKGASLPLLTRQMFEAANASRARVKDVLEQELKRLRNHRFEPRIFQHRGADWGRKD